MRRSAWLVVLLAFAAAGCGGSSDGAAGDAPRSTTSAASSDAGDDASGGSGPVSLGPADFQFRPVLALEEAAARPASTSPGAEGTVLDSSDGQLRYTVGPAGFTGEALSSARAVEDGSGGWVVEVEVAPEEQRAANALLDACFRAEDTCPSSSVPSPSTTSWSPRPASARKAWRTGR